ncbi:RICIN domain-containing protein [Saccharothrix variisporea]|uniref:Intein/RHS repeat-associated protein n=1 Tax=Saccharothrix variisporea TaxID=543527 RepID=A0A495X8B7_9PSEU|nr:RICIN domain-containing protein [Saccharothrix variisporea]RKT69405.1 intein/RHS repeat-associated protein [Saccharothrix variisporea]
MSGSQSSRAENPFRRGLAVAVAFVMVASTAVAAGVTPAVAAAQPPVSETPPVRNEAADIPSARATAALHKIRVEALSERTENSATFVNPDGKLTTEIHAGPVRVKRGDAWVPVDLTLDQRADGSIAPRVHPRDLVFAGAGGTADAVRDLASLRHGETEVALQWRGVLPAPRIEGRKVVYPDARPGADLVVEATRTGFEQFLVLKERPKEPVRLTLPLRTKGATPKRKDDGHTELVDGSGNVVGAIPQPEMWDAKRHEKTGDPVKKHPVGVEVAPGQARAAGQTVTELTLTADESFLKHADTQYPVVIDPVVYLGPVYDKYVQTGTTVDTGGQSELRLGTFDGGATVARSYFNFDVAQFKGRRIHSARLNLWEWHSWSCEARDWELWDTGLVDWSTNWNSQPPWYTRWSTSSETRGHSASCDDGWVGSDIRGLVQLGADNGSNMLGIMAKAANESDNYGWKRFDSAEAEATPHITIDYNSRPDPATGLDVSDRGDSGGQTFTRSTTPTLSFRPSDPDGGTVTAVFYVYDGDTMVTDHWVWGVPSGSVATWKVPDGLLQPGRTYRFRATSFDAHDWAGDAFVAIRPVHSGKAVDIAGCSTAAGTHAIQWDYWGGGCQRFALVGTGDGYYMLRARHSDHVLDVAGCGTADGTQVIQWPGNGNDCQKWRLDRVGNGEYTLVAKHSGKVMDVQYGSPDNGQKIWTWTGNGCTCQKFRLDAAPDPGVNLQWLQFTVDTVDPGAPFVSSTDYPNDNKWYKGANQAGTFTFTPPAGTADVHSYLWALDAVPTTEAVAGADGKATPSITPATDGQHTLNVRTKDRSGRLSGITSYTFHVGRAGLLRPAEGVRVPRRVQLQVVGEPVFTHVKFMWRRGPGAAVESDIPPAHLTKADGSPLGSGFVPLNSYGEFAVWNAVDTLGEAAGVVQVKAVLATDSAGNGTYATAWRTAVVDPSADNAASTSIGPGSVNLLTGDYSVNSTDAEEFGLSVSRTSSSRDPRHGFQLQRQRLTTNQQKVSTDMAGFVGNTASIARNTERGHDSTDSLEVTAPTGNQSGNDTFASIEGDMSGGMRLGMKAGRTYRVTGWIYVPAASGLQPEFGRGLKMTAFAKTPAGYREWSTARPSAVDAWQQLTLDFTVPADATEAFIRLYNGFAPGSGKKVYYDDLSLREITAPFGPHWETGAEVDSAQIDYTRLAFPHEDTVQVEQASGSSIWFTRTPDGKFWPEPGAEDLTLVKENDVYRLSELDGTVTTFAKPAGTDRYVVETATPPLQANTTRYTYDNTDDQLRIKRVIAPQEPGIGDCTTATPARGCEALEYDYAATTTATATAFGDIAGQIRAIAAWTTDPATGAVSKVDVARYAYDDQGRLREVWDPRLAQPLKTSYAYDAAGHVTEIGQPGDLPWKFTFGAAGSGDPNTGRLLKVRRDALRPGTKDQVDGEIATIVVYGVPLTRAAGGPHDLDATAIATWAQADAPTDAVAVFGPEDPVSVHTASASSPGADGYRAATVHYLNASGKEANTATPGGHIDTHEYDRFGNVVRTLESSNRALALGQAPNAEADLSTLGLAQYDSKTRATWLDSRSTYGSDGLDLLEALGPLHRIALANDPSTLVNARAITRTSYDEGKPDGVAYHLPTTERVGARVVGMADEQDVRITKREYGPMYGGASGWTLRKATKVITAAETAQPLEAATKYDDQGRARESRKIDSSGSDAGTVRSVFYTAGANPDDAACGNRPEWAGQACVVRAVGAITGHDAARMVGEMPVKRVESYTKFGEPDRITETVAGKTRTTVNTYDGADRLVGTVITGDVGEAVQQVGTDYDPVSGDALTTKFADGTKVSREFDRLGRLVRYTDADGAWTATEFDRFGKPAKITDSIGTSQTFTYDRVAEPRGLVTSVTDSVGGAIGTRYGPDGQIVGLDLPGGVVMDQQLDPAGIPVARTYRKDGTVIAASAVVENAQGQWLRHTGPGSDKRYSYDTLGRLTKVQDTSAATGLCTVRTYTFDRRTNRTGRSTRSASTAGACPGEGEPAQSSTHTYDSADRLTDPSWVYDAFGRITATPDGVQNSFYVNDLVRSQQTADKRIAWTLDPALRQRAFTAEKLVNGTWANAVTKVNHYADDSDEPRWITEDVTQNTNVTRNVSSPEGDLALTTGLSGDIALQLTNLHGDVMATVPVASGQLGAVTVLDADEYGVPSADTPAAATARYAWLGGKQRSAEALGGVVLMGVRLYHPGTGRFWQPDPEDGGNATPYDYCAGDPVNCTDLDGRWGWLKKVGNVVAKVAEVASYIPGPIGAAAGAVSTVAYAATGNYRKAAEMAITAAANLVGAGAAVKAGMAAVKAASRSVPKMASRLAKPQRSAVPRGRGGGCNSFTPETLVAMADGTARPISEIQVGDLVHAADPVTGAEYAQPVVEVFVSHGAKHLIEFGVDGGGVPITATANHPIWVDGKGWTDARDIGIGDRVLLPGGATAAIRHVRDLGVTGQLVYNLNVSAVHTYSVVTGTAAVLVHNASAACLAANRAAGKKLELRVQKSMEKRYGRANVEAQVYFWTPLGRRFADLKVTGPRGAFLVEVKAGKSRYTVLQRAKDAWIHRRYGLRTYVYRR